MRTKSEVRYIALVLLACLVLAWTASAATQATITTDQQHYSVGATMTIYGTGFSNHVLIELSVLTPSHSTEIVSGVTTDNQGSFTAQYTPADQQPGRYTITATDGANRATTATTEADSIGFNKGVYDKAVVSPTDTTGHWTTGNAGSNYVENQWAFYQYEATGVTSMLPSFDVTFNHFDSSKSAVFVDAFANFRACIDCADGTHPSGPSQGMLLDGDPPPLARAWPEHCRHLDYCRLARCHGPRGEPQRPPKRHHGH
jgi:hypothetical protein